MRQSLPRLLAQQQQLLDTTAIVAGVPTAPADPAGAGVPAVPSIDERLESLRIAITDQETPIGPPMRNRPIALKVFAIDARLEQAIMRLNTMTDVVANGLEDIGLKFDLLNSQRQLDLAAAQVERTRNDLQDAKDELQDAALAQLAAQDKLTMALDAVQSADIEQGRLDTAALAVRQTATEKKQAADELDIASIKASDASQAAQLVAQASGIESDRQLAQAAQATAEQARLDAKAAKDLAQTAKDRADQAEADAQAAKTAAGQAQATANAATAGVTAANARIDAVVANVNTAQASAKAAQDTATAAQQAVTAQADRGRVLLGVVTPASAGVLSNGGTISVSLKWDKPFNNIEYAGSFIRTSGGTSAMGVSLTNKTLTSCTLVLTYNGTLSLAVPAGTGDVVLTHS
jgi:hypothetical protein